MSKNENVNVLGFTQESAIAYEITSLEKQMSYAEEMKDHLKRARKELADGYSGVLDSHDQFLKIRKENIEELRRYKFSIVAEAKEIETSIRKVSQHMTPQLVAQLSEFANACEKLESLRIDGFFELFSSGKTK